MAKRRRSSPTRRNRLLTQPARSTKQRKSFTLEKLELRSLLSGVSLSSVPNWVEQGPGPEINSGSTLTFPQKNEVSGAIESIAVGPGRVVVGTVNGGVWSTATPLVVGGGQPVWTPLTDQLPSLAIGAVAFDPTDASGNTFYAGTGLFSNAFDVGGPAVGIYRTTDGGSTWTVLDGSLTTGVQLNGHRIKALIADGQTILAGAIDGDGINGSRNYVTNGGGLYRSTDGGATFFKITGTGAGDLPAGAVTSLVLDPNNATTVYAAVSGQGVFRSNNLGAAGSWTPVNSGLTTLSAGTTDIELGDQNIGGTTTLFAGIENDSTNAVEVFTSGNSGGSWTQLAAVPASFPQPGLGAFAEKLNIIADPTNAGIVYIDGMGGTGIYRYNPAGAGSWVQIDQGGTQNNSSPHADSRDMAFSAGWLLEADDGGIFAMTTPLNATANDWISLNSNLRTFEFYSVAYDSTNHVIFGGVQDNGSPAQTSQNGVANWTDLSGGDGQFQAVDTTSLGGGNVYRYSMSDNFQFFNRAEFDSSNNQIGAFARVAFRSAVGNPYLSGLNAADKAFALSGAFSKVPFTLNSVDPTRMLIGFNGVYEDAGLSVAAGGAAGDLVANITSGFAGLSGKVSAVLYGGQRAGIGQVNVAFVGTTSGELYFRGESGSTFTRVDGAGAGQLGGSGTVWSIAVDPKDWRHVFVVKGNQLFATNDITNLATNPFQVIGGGTADNLLSMSGQLRTVTAIDVAGQTVPLVTGQGGLFRSLTPGQWTEYGKGLPNVVAHDVVYNAADNVMVLGTFGRGVWTIPNALTSLTAPAVLQITGDQDFSGENDTFRLVRDATSPTLVHVFVNGVEDPASPFQLATIQQINVNGLGGDDTLIIDDSNGLINVPGGIHVDGGTGRNAIQVVQTGGATQVSDVYTVGPNNGDGTDLITGPTGTQNIVFQNLSPFLDTAVATTATVNGTPADNAINYTTGSVAANGLITIDNQESYEFSNKTNLIINGGAGSDTINLNNQAAVPTGLTSITVNGNDPTASDTLIVNGIVGAADDLQVVPTGTSSGTIADTPAAKFVGVTFTGIEHLTMVGQLADADGLDISSTAGNDAYTYTPGATGDAGLVTGTANGLSFGIVPVAFSGFRSFVTPLAFNLGGTDTLTIDGTSGDDVIGFSNQAFPLPPGTVSQAAVVNGGTPLFYSSGLVNVVLNGLTGNDTLNLTGDGTPATVTMTSTGMTITGGGLAPVAAPLTIVGAGAVNLNNGAGAVAVGGSSATDSIDVTPTGANTAAIQLNGGGLVLNATTTGALTTGNFLDTVTVHGSGGDDTINVVRGTALNTETVTVAPGGIVLNKPITVPIAQVGNLALAAGLGNDTVNVSNAAATLPGTELTLLGNSSAANTTLNVTNLSAGTTSVVAGATNDSGQILTADGTINFAGVSRVTLTDPNNDGLIVHGTGADDAIAAAQTAGLNEVTVGGHAPIDFTSFGSLTLDGGAGNDMFNISPAGLALTGAATITVTGAAGANDTLTVNGRRNAADAITYTPATTTSDTGSVAIAGLSTVNFSTTAHLIINGQNGGPTAAGDDSLTINTSNLSSGQTEILTPGSTFDSGHVDFRDRPDGVSPIGVPVDFLNLGAAGNISFADAGGGGNLIYNGTAANDTFAVNAGGQVVLNKQIPVNTAPDMRTITLAGLAGNDSFNIAGNHNLPGPGGGQPGIIVEGGNPANNTLNFTGNGAGAVTVDVTAQTVTQAGFAPVSFSGVGTVNLNAGAAAATVTGSTSGDAFNIAPTGANTATVQANGVAPSFNLTAASLTIGDASSHQVTVNGTPGQDTIGVARGAITTIAVNGLLPVNVDTANASALTVASGQGADTIDVTGAGGLAAISVLGAQTPAADTLNVTNSATAGNTIYNAGDTNDSGNLANADGTINFSGVSLVKDRAGAAADSLTVNGTNGNDTITAAHLGANNVAWVNAQAPISFTTFGTLTLNGRFGNDSFVVSPFNMNLAGLNSVSVIGNAAAGANNAVILNGSAAAGNAIGYSATGPGSATFTVGSAPQVLVANANSIAINGQAGNNGLTITTPITAPNDANQVTLTPGAAIDSASVAITSANNPTSEVPMSFSNLGAGASVTFAHTGGGRTDALTYNGTSGSDTFNVAGTGGGAIALNGQLLVTTPGIANLTLSGLAGDDTFNVAGGLPFATTTLDGSEPSASDIANLLGATRPVAVNLGDSGATPPSNTTITGYGGTITLSGVEVGNLDANGNALVANGTARNDTITYTPSGAAAGSFVSAGLNTTFNFTAATSTFTINGGGGNANQVKVNGDPGRDLFAIREDLRSASITDASGILLEPVVLGPTVQILSAFGIGGQNTFQVTPAAGTQFAATGNLDNLLVNVDGGSGGQSNALVIQSATGGTLAANQFVIDNRDVIGNSGTIRTFTAAVQWPDINYTNIKVVSPLVASPSNLLAMGPDNYEPNESQAGAANLGVAGNIQVSHASVFPNAAEFPNVPADQDYYSVTAQQSGTLDFIANFRLFSPALLPAGGNLNLQVLDAAGNVIATASGGAASFGAVGATANARIRIPVVAGQTYTLHVFGANANGSPNGAVVNGYDLSIVDTPAIVPFNLELSRSVAAGIAGSPDTGDLPPAAPADDTGRSQFDNVTDNNKPRIYLRLSDGIFLNDLPGNGGANNPPAGVIPIPFSPNATTPGFRVAIFDGNDTQNPVGFANQVTGFPGLYEFDFPNPLADGVHNLTAEVQMVDPAAAHETGFGGVSATLAITIDTAKPPVAFGTGVAGGNTGLDGTSDSGVNGQPTTMVDRVTNVSTPTLYGVAEANSIVRLYDDVNGDGIVDAGDVFLGQATAVPGDGTNALPNGQWRIISNVDLNSTKLGFPLDGTRNLLVTAEDLAGNVSAPQALSIFIDTQGPRVGNVGITGSPGFNLFLNKPATPAPTPLVNSLDVTFNDQPIRVGPDFVYPAVNPALATTVGNYYLLGEHTGPIAITSVTFADSTTAGTPGMSVATLHFAAPLPDDRYTLTISDHITDNAGNSLDGEFNGGTFPSGNGTSGGFFTGSFTVDSRPEIGVYSSGTVSLDLNGNGTLDPLNNDANNRDAVVTLGYPTDRIFAGQFSSTYGGSAAPVVNGFDKLASYGVGTDGNYRWLYDLSGVSQGAPTVVRQPVAIDGLPVAGNFDGSPLVSIPNRPPVAKDGQQVGLFDGKAWYLDVLNQGYISAADLAAPASATHPAGKLASNMAGLPFVGDFDGDGHVDLATYQDGVMEFDLSSLEPNHVVTGQVNEKLDLNQLFPSSIPFNTVNARPVAADLDADGLTDFGLYVPGRTDTAPGTAQWYFIESNFGATAPNAASALSAPLPASNPFMHLVHTFQNAAFGGHDASYQLGNQFALPVVGNFDPPSGGSSSDSTNDAPASVTATAITNLYVQILGRQPVPGEVGYWASQIDQGLTAAQLAQMFVTSNEYRANQIEQLYQQYLGRSADAAGLTYWTGVWNSTGGPEQVQVGIFASPEFLASAQKHSPNLSAGAAWISELYRDLLNRDPTAKDIDYWSNYLNDHSAASVVSGFLTSDEYRFNLIAGEFQTYLGRALDRASAQALLVQLRNGLTQDQLLMIVLSSDEYLNKS